MPNISPNPFTKVRNAKDLAAKQYNAFSWFQSRVKELGDVAKSANRVMNATPGKQFFNTLEVGSLFLFNYDAKHKDTLPYWDRFPLILPFTVKHEHMIGFNLHYLPYAPRFKLMQQLMKVKEDKFLTARTKLQYSYGMLKESSKYEILKPCIKMYLPPHVRSQFMKIHPKDWLTAVMLPVDQFVGKNKSFVWKESMRSVNG